MRSWKFTQSRLFDAPWLFLSSTNVAIKIYSYNLLMFNAKYYRHNEGNLWWVRWCRQRRPIDQLPWQFPIFSGSVSETSCAFFSHDTAYKVVQYLFPIRPFSYRSCFCGLVALYIRHPGERLNERIGHCRSIKILALFWRMAVSILRFGNYSPTRYRRKWKQKNEKPNKGPCFWSRSIAYIPDFWSAVIDVSSRSC